MKKIIYILFILLYTTLTINPVFSQTKNVKRHLKKDRSRKVPAGTIMAFAGPEKNVPVGWTICDGKKISAIENIKLFDAIGTNWGGDGAPFYNVPDLRGYFLRGIDTNEETEIVDNDRATRKDNNGTIGPKVGSYQADEVVIHNHQIKSMRTQKHSHCDGGSGFNALWAQHNCKSESKNTIDFGGKETRPKNAYVHWIIKL